MARRQSINLDGFAHTNPIPVACKVGNVVMSSRIMPRDAKGKVPDTLDGQCALLFDFVKEVMTKAGGTTENIVKMGFDMKDLSQREVLNKHWTQVFPDPESRPARHTAEDELPSGVLIACELTAVIGS